MSSKKQSKKKSFFKKYSTLILASTIGIAVIGSSFYITKKLDEDDEKGKTTKSESDLVLTNIEDSWDGFIDDLKEFNENNEKENYYGYRGDVMFEESLDSKSSSDATGMGNAEYSGTNVQVEGVDEGDFIKTDGEYIYIAKTQNRRSYRGESNEETKQISIIKANSETGELEKISKIEIGKEINSIQHLHLYEDKLVVVGQVYSYYDYPVLYDSDEEVESKKMPADRIQKTKDHTKVLIYDVENPKNPKLEKDYRADGSILTTRFTDGVLYLVNNNYNGYQLAEEIRPLLEKDDDKKIKEVFNEELPYSGESEKYEEDKNDEKEFSYIAPINSYDTANLTSVSLKNSDYELNQEIVMGYAQTVYASKDNLYLASNNYSYWWYGNPDYEEATTTIFKFNLNKGDIKFQTEGSVKGTALNQFSMDEYDGNLRIATTRNQYTPVFRSPEDVIEGLVGITPSYNMERSNSLYILDEDLTQIGEVENLAKGEQIYSVRFMGDRGYVVTFKNTDPLFAFDLSDPKNPEVLGELKIPGYSDYLHPIDENTLVGIGKDAIPSDYSEDFAWYQGVKIGLFDVSDMNNPVELDSEIIGDRGTGSESLYDHKAILWDSRNNLLVLPIDLYVIPDGVDEKDEWGYARYGEFEYQGSYVYNIEDGEINLEGRVSHLPEDITKDPYNFYEYFIKRQMYLNDYLLTISETIIQSNNLKTLEFVDKTEI